MRYQVAVVVALRLVAMYFRPPCVSTGCGSLVGWFDLGAVGYYGLVGMIGWSDVIT